MEHCRLSKPGSRFGRGGNMPSCAVSEHDMSAGFCLSSTCVAEPDVTNLMMLSLAGESITPVVDNLALARFGGLAGRRECI